MRIISKPAVPDWKGLWKCNVCRCVWEIDETDTPPMLFQSPLLGSFHAMECPNCKKQIQRTAPSNPPSKPPKTPWLKSWAQKKGE